MEGGDENMVESEGVGIFKSERLLSPPRWPLPLLKSNLADPTLPTPTPTDPPPVSLLIPPTPATLLFISKLKGVVVDDGLWRDSVSRSTPVMK